MRNLKLLFIMAFLLITAAVNAQLSFGVKAGLNASNVYGKDIDSGSSLIGYHAGLTLEYHFNPLMTIQSGLYIQSKGHTDKHDDSDKIKLTYLQIPIHAAYKIEVMPETKIELHAGPYIAYGISGKSEYKEDGKKESEKIKFGSELSELKPFDAGIGIGVGAEFGFFLVDLGYDLGLVNMLNTSSFTLKNQHAYLSVGIRF